MSTYTIVRVAVDEHLATTFAADERCHLVKLVALALPFDLDGFVGHLVLVQSSGIGPPPHDKSRVRFRGLDNSLLDVLVDRGLDGAHEPGPHVDPLCAEAQGRSQTLAVSESA